MSGANGLIAAGMVDGLTQWVTGLAFLVATVIALWGGIKYGPKGEWGSFFKVVGIAVVIMILTGGSFLATARSTGENLVKDVTTTAGVGGTTQNG